nr:MAG: HNH endonuclease [Bacteriophage sp.]
MKLKFNFNKRNRYKNICSIEGCNNSACGKYCNKHYHQIKRYGNLRICTISDNMYNTYRQRNNSTGVRKHIQKGKYISYQAYISINNKQINLGYFDTKEKAIAARKFAERKYNDCVFNKYLCYGLLCNIVVLKVVKDEEMRNNK